MRNREKSHMKYQEREVPLIVENDMGFNERTNKAQGTQCLFFFAFPKVI